MVITVQTKILKTVDSVRSVINEFRTVWEPDSYTEHDIEIAASGTEVFSAQKGLILQSDVDMVLTGDVDVTVEKLFVFIAPVSAITVTNQSSTDEMTVRAIILN